MKDFSMKRFTASLLAIVMIVSLFPAGIFDFAVKVSAAETSVPVDGAIFFSDLHTNKSNYKESVLKNVLNSIKDNNPDVTFTSITSGGDAFSVNEDNSSSNGPYTGYTSTLNGYINNVFTDGIDISYVWSDHDRYAVKEDGTTLLDKTSHLSYGAGVDGIYGTSDDDNYYVYTLSMGDLSSNDRYESGFAYTESNYTDRAANGFTATVLQAIENFKSDAAKLKKDRPLFIVSHQPLFDRRNDNAWAEDWFEAINEVAANMDVAFFFGHNHKYDQAGDYYHAKGSTINVTTRDGWNYNYNVGSQNNSDRSSAEKTLAFTHMCMGYLEPTSTGSYSSTGTRRGTALAVTIYEDSIRYVTYDENDVYTGNFAADYTVTRDHAVVEPDVPDASVEDSSTGIIVIAPGITAVNASKLTVAKPEGYAAYITYDINPVGYTNGDKATVIAPVDSSFNPSKTVVVLDGSTVIANTDIVDGKVTFTTNHFSLYSIAQLSFDTVSDEWVEIIEPIPGTPGTDDTVGYEYILDTTGVNTGETNKYLITSTGDIAMHYGTSFTSASVYQVDGDSAYMLNRNSEWYFVASGSGYLITNGTRYLRFQGANNNKSGGTLTTTTRSNEATKWSIRHNGDGNYSIYVEHTYKSGKNNRTEYCFIRYNNGFTIGANASESYASYVVRLYLYEGEKVIQEGSEGTSGHPGTYAMITGDLEHTVDRGTSWLDAREQLRKGIVAYTADSDDGANPQTLDTSNLTLTIEDGYDGLTPGEYKVTVEYEGKELGLAKIIVPEKEISSAVLDKYEGSVPRNSTENAETGAKIIVTYVDGTTSTVDVTLGMLSGTTLDVSKNGTCEGLTVSYNNWTFEDFKLEVTNVVGNDYPEFPDKGAVKVNKTAIYKDEEYRRTGVAQVELSVAGISMEKGVDVIVMLDLSSSMERCIVCGSKTCSHSEGSRLDEMKDALLELEKSLKNSTNAANIKIAIADFNGMYTSGPTDRADDGCNNYTQDKAGLTSGAKDNVYTGSKTDGLGAEDFISVKDLDVSTFKFTPSSGTNYDHAFDVVYQLGYGIKQENIKNGTPDRDLFVIFMSDGAANQFNYYTSIGGDNTGSTDWNAWLSGNIGEGKDYTFKDIVNCQKHTYYYDSKTGNQHRMANAIKGDPNELYEVIRKNQTSEPDAVTGALVPLTSEDTNYGKDNMYKLPGLGATTYTIAFYVINDGPITAESAKHSLKATATSEDHYIDASTQGALAAAFTKIGGSIAYAANNARFVDQLGGTFDLQMASSVNRTVDGQNISLEFSPVIEVKSYDIWTRQEFDNDVFTDEKMIGERKGTSSLIEVIMFSPDGSKAYSNKIDVDKDGQYGVTVNADGTNTLNDTDDNILSTDGLIYAKSFLYNTDKMNEVTASGTSITVQPETFYWMLGTVMEDELAISYYVYLTDSLEGERPSGSYATNNFAILYYDNYLGNECYLETLSPMLAWNEANVSYAFYLVNSDGQIVINRTNGQTGGFADKIEVTRPIVFDTCKLNTQEEIKPIEILNVNNILPEGYELYDPSATYSILVLSDEDDAKIGWEIYSGKQIASTYVTGFSDKIQFSNALTSEQLSGYQNFVYTHTTVWFAVKWVPSTIPDQVVVDYGLPVDISVLENDLFRLDSAKLYGIGISKPAIDPNWNYTTEHPAGFGSTLAIKDGLKYGTASLNGTKVRYTPENMQMNGYDRFYYEIQYTTESETQYYFGEVTVIPATNIYYEEKFVTFTDAASFTDQYGKWVNDGTYNSSATQGEDRPGKNSLSTIDHDNLYGYDGINSSATTFSLGSAKKVSVNAEVGNNRNNSPTATFSFTGTGFDVISMTNSESGAIFISVTDKNGKAVKNGFVDNYYGYKYVEETDSWIPEPKGAIYQVPVIKVNGLTYGTYDVTIWVTYNKNFDHDITDTDKTKAGYTFWLDSIRIYDPANDGDGNTVIKDAYEKDGESYPQYLKIKDAILDPLMIKDEILGSLKLPAGAKLPGAVFIDGIPENEFAEAYKNPGPNNELYLAPGQSISFKLQANANPLDVQIGAKLANGIPAVVQLTYTIIIGGDPVSETRIRQFTTATDMYYSMSEYLSDTDQSALWQTGTITLTNITETVENGTPAIVSLTNIKATFESDSVKLIGASVDNNVQPDEKGQDALAAYAPSEAEAFEETESSETVAPVETEPVSISFLVDDDVIVAACAVMNNLYAPAPETEAPETKVPETEAPETQVPETEAPETKVPETEAPETQAPETQAPETQAPETQEPDVSVDDVQGDLDGSGSVDINDAFLLFVNSMFGDKYYPITYSGSTDFNQDGTVDIRDALRLFMHSMLHDKYPIFGSEDAKTEAMTALADDKKSGHVLLDPSEVQDVMAKLAVTQFIPEAFEAFVNVTPDGTKQVIAQTSEDVEYIVVNGEILNRYIKKTVIDAETGETKTVKRIWITESKGIAEEEEITVHAYDQKGVVSKEMNLKSSITTGNVKENTSSGANEGNDRNNAPTPEESIINNNGKKRGEN